MTSPAGSQASAFRRYASSPLILTGNVCRRTVHEYEEGWQVTTCDVLPTDRARFDVSQAPVFNATAHPAERSCEPSRMLRAMRACSVASPRCPPELGV